jgi:hypothetical protein
MGGALTFAAAQHAGVDAAAPFYGIPDPAICQVGYPEGLTGPGTQGWNQGPRHAWDGEALAPGNLAAPPTRARPTANVQGAPL